MQMVAPSINHKSLDHNYCHFSVHAEHVFHTFNLHFWYIHTSIVQEYVGSWLYRGVSIYTHLRLASQSAREPAICGQVFVSTGGAAKPHNTNMNGGGEQLKSSNQHCSHGN